MRNGEEKKKEAEREKDVFQNIQFAYEQSGELTYIEDDKTGEKKNFKKKNP